MAVAKKCDICGKLYEPYNSKKDGNNPNGIMFLNIDDSGSYWKNTALDCCPECMKFIKNHIKKLNRLKDKVKNLTAEIPEWFLKFLRGNYIKMETESLHGGNTKFIFIKDFKSTSIIVPVESMSEITDECYDILIDDCKRFFDIK